MRVRFVSALLAATVLSIAPVHAETLTAAAKAVHDGDTLTLTTGQRIRLFGIDAPELKQQCKVGDTCRPCGDEARKVLNSLATGPLVCEGRGESYDRVVARCTAGEVDLSLAMLETGQAVAYGRYLKKSDPLRAKYLGAEAAAKKAGLGIWGTKLIPPGDWRNHKMRLECER